MKQQQRCQTECTVDEARMRRRRCRKKWRKRKRERKKKPRKRYLTERRLSSNGEIGE